MIFDTDILISYTKRRLEAAAFLRAVPFAERRVSVISLLELMYGCRDARELRATNEFLSEAFVQILPLTPQICDASRAVMNQFVLSRRPSANDTLIACTALAAGEVLATGNVKHFEYIPGLQVKPFSPLVRKKEQLNA